MDSDSGEVDHKPVVRDIRLDASNLKEYGFSLFCYPDEWEKVRKEGYRMINLGRNVDGSFEYAKVQLSEKYLWRLSGKNELKLPRQNDFMIEKLKELSEGPKILSSRAGWNQTDLDFEILLRLAGESYFMAEIRHFGKKIPLGSGAVIDIGENVSWISMILVHEEVRRQGIAASLMCQCLKAVRETHENRIVGLDATPQGNQLYQKMGFVKSYSICRCLVPDQPDFRIAKNKSVEGIYRYDAIRDYLHQRGFGERDVMFHSLYDLSSGNCFLVRTNNATTGFVMSRPGALRPYVGPLIADSDEDAALLLHEIVVYWKERGENRLFIDVPSGKLKTVDTDSKNGETAEDPPDRVKNGFLTGGKIIRTFDRMYHLVSEKNRNDISGFLKNNFTDEETIDRILRNSSGCYDLTMNYIEKERDEMLRYQYGIGGPEYS